MIPPPSPHHTKCKKWNVPFNRVYGHFISFLEMSLNIALTSIIIGGRAGWFVAGRSRFAAWQYRFVAGGKYNKSSAKRKVNAMSKEDISKKN